MSYWIAPSILSADITCLAEEVAAVVDAGADALHLDVMDNHYVPNLTFGAALCEALHRRFPQLPLDVHLMASPVDPLIVQFGQAGAARISIHPEACIHLDRSLSLIREQGCLAGLVLNPASSPECIPWCRERLDFVLVMTVNPGFAGQTLIPAVVDKIRFLRQQYPDLPLCVDGGVNETTIAALAAAGCQQFVAGSAIFSSKHYGQALQRLRARLKQ